VLHHTLQSSAVRMGRGWKLATSGEQAPRGLLRIEARLSILRVDREEA
jgi:hypothetical protein